MAIISYHASHEQFKPSELLAWAVLAEKAGFDGINSSDHFFPWSERQGESGFSFAWLGAAMQATSLPFGLVCAPGPRYHPAILAQAAATLSEMFPDRFWMALGSGEALNENITGAPWPDKETRNRRLYESADVIKKLLNGDHSVCPRSQPFCSFFCNCCCNDLNCTAKLQMLSKKYLNKFSN